MKRIALTALALILIASPAVAEKDTYTMKQLTPSVRAYMNKGWNYDIQACFNMAFGDIEEDRNGDWKIVADVTNNSLSASSKSKDSFFKCDQKGLTEKSFGGRPKFTPMSKLPIQ